MDTPTNHPSIESLVEVDGAACEYNDKCVEIEGVVSPSGQGGWPHSTGDYKVHCFSFAAWRRVGHPLLKRKLTILRPVPAGEDLFTGFSALSIHRINVLLSKDETRAVFATSAEPTGQDAELLAVAAELAKPVIVATEQFGDLAFDRRTERFEGKAIWNGEPVSISFDPGVALDISAALATAEELWNAQAAWKEKVDAFAVKKLLPVKNDNWLDEDEEPLTADEFKGRMTLKSVSISNDGSFGFRHDDGDLFWGHWIQVEGSLSEGLTDADIPG